VSCAVGHRCGSDPALLWLWRRPVAIAPIREQPKKWQKDQKKKKKKQPNSRLPIGIAMLCGFLVILAVRVKTKTTFKRLI